MRQPSFGQDSLQPQLSFYKSNRNAPMEPCEPLQGPLTVLATHKVQLGKEAEFEAWCQELLEEQSRFDGFHGIEVIRPTCCDEKEHVTIFRYDTYDQVEAWMNSPERERMQEKARKFEEEDIKVTYHSLEFWFINEHREKDGDEKDGSDKKSKKQRRSAATGPPPKWKMAIVTFFVMWPSIRYIASLYFRIEGLPEWLAQMFGVMTVVTLTTYVTMPIVTMYVFNWFLFPVMMMKKALEKPKLNRGPDLESVSGRATETTSLLIASQA